MGMDKRIGRSFLDAGIGYGGFCFPKDAEAFIRISEKLGYNFQLLKAEAQLVSSHIKLLNTEINLIGNYVYVRFLFDTDDAMGMNMATIATEQAVNLIEKKTKVFLYGNEVLV